MAKVVKPRKRIMFRWFFDKGGVFVVFAMALLFFISYNILRQDIVSNIWFYTLSGLMLLIISTTIFASMFYERNKKQYYILENYLHIRDGKKMKRVLLKEIKDVKTKDKKLYKLLKLKDIELKKGNETIVLEGIHKNDEVDVILFNKIKEKKLE